MKGSLLLLAVLPAGLLLGFLGARLVDPGTTRDQARQSAVEASAAPPFERAPPAPVGLPAPSDAGLADQSGRPDLDWGAEAWPVDQGDYSSGPYALDDDYFGRSGEGALGGPDEGRDEGAVAAADARAYAAGAAAERAARDAARAAAAPSSAGRAGDVPQVRPTDAPRGPARSEPRTANGDLPAIW